MKKLCRDPIGRPKEEILDDSNTHVWAVVETVAYGRVEELSEMPHRETTVSRAGRGGASTDLLEDGVGVGFRNQGGTMAVVPRAFLQIVRKATRISDEEITCSSLKTWSFSERLKILSSL